MITSLKKNQKISPGSLINLCDEWFETFVKIVVDIESETVAVGGELHSDAEAILLEQGSLQKNIWGANFYPFNPPEERLEFTSLINIRPRDNNPGMEIMDASIRDRVKDIAEKRLLDPQAVLTRRD